MSLSSRYNGFSCSIMKRRKREYQLEAIVENCIEFAY